MKGKNRLLIKYRLSDREILDVYYKEPRLAILLDLDVVKIIDNHLVVNLPKFITPKTKHLTKLAKRNLSSCCIGVQYEEEYTCDSVTNTSISCNLDILLKASSFLERGDRENGVQSFEEQKEESSKIFNEIERLNEIINEMPGSFSGSLKYIMEKKGYTEELLSEISWISLSTIKQYRQKEEKEKTLKTVTALCIGLHLHPWITEELIRKAGIVPKATKQDGAYKFLYTTHYKDSIEECNIYLRSQNLQEFKLREKAS